jgi:hypothetical protein
VWRSLGVPTTMGEDVKAGSASATVGSFLAWTHLAVRVVVGCGRPERF